MLLAASLHLHATANNFSPNTHGRCVCAAHDASLYPARIHLAQQRGLVVTAVLDTRSDNLHVGLIHSAWPVLAAVAVPLVSNLNHASSS